MKKISLSILIIMLYCFPYVYFSMYKVFDSGSMIGYLIMIVGTFCLAFFGKRTNNTLALFTGNIVSAIISYYFVKEMAVDERWGGYFKSFAPEHILFLISLLNLIPQIIGIQIAKNHKK